jgi:molybdopterin-guanine dinucleotide biosynthesis protein MobB
VGARGVPIVAVVGQSGSGKTTLLERLIPELKRRGWRVGAVKHTHHTFDFDPRGKDSARLFRSGAEVFAFASTSELAVMRQVQDTITLDDLVRTHMTGVDVVLVEGYKELAIPKIEVLGRGKAPSCPVDDLLAVVTEDDLGTSAPRFRPDDAAGLAQLIETRILGERRSRAGRA